MAETWDRVFRQVILRGNLLQADDASTLATNYTTALIGQTEMSDRAIMFPKVAVDDAILNAGDRMVGLIGLDKNSPYRSFFAGVTSNVASGAAIPLISSTSKTRVGVIGDVLDASTSKKCVAKEYQEVIGVGSMTLKQSPHFYYTDNVRIWHTRTNVVIDIVVWDKADQLTLMAQTAGGVRGACPFPQELHEGLVCGALSYLFRGEFNVEQAKQWRATFNEVLAQLGTHLSSDEVEKRKLTE